jgi:hypothetical protein
VIRRLLAQLVSRVTSLHNRLLARVRGYTDDDVASLRRKYARAIFGEERGIILTPAEERALEAWHRRRRRGKEVRR